MMLDRPATTVSLVSVGSGRDFSTTLVPAAVGNINKIFDVDSALTDTSISGAYIDEIWFQYSKRVIEYIDARTSTTSGTFSATGTNVVVTISGGHNVQVGQKVYITFSGWSSGTSPASQAITVTAVTSTTFTGTIPSVAGTITGNASCYLPIDACFYLTNVSSVLTTDQILPLFVASIPATYENQFYSLTLNNVLPLINHPVVQAGSNFTSANSTTSPKTRGLMLKRGQALYVAFSNATLASPFYVGVQAGYY